MSNLVLDIITKRLKNAPQNIIDRVLGYIDAISPENDFSLSLDQLNELDKRIANAETKDFIPWDKAKKQLNS